VRKQREAVTLRLETAVEPTARLRLEEPTSDAPGVSAPPRNRSPIISMLLGLLTCFRMPEGAAGFALFQLMARPLRFRLARPNALIAQ